MPYVEPTDGELAREFIAHLGCLPNQDAVSISEGNTAYSPRELAQAIEKREEPLFTRWMETIRLLAQEEKIDPVEWLRRR